MMSDTNTITTKYLSIKRLAQYLGCSPSKVNSLRSARLLPRPVLIGGSPAWIAEEVDAFLMENCRGDQ